MKNRNKYLVFFLIFLLAFYAPAKAQTMGWKGGVASTIITPEKSMWMMGHSWRKHKSDPGKHNDIKAKALALEDANGKKVLLITLDLSGIHRGLANRIKDYFFNKYQLQKKDIIINASHTHSGPTVYREDTGSGAIALGKDSGDLSDRKLYTEELERKIVMTGEKAINMMQPVKLFSGNGLARIQVNRRNNSEFTAREVTEFAGPNDFSVPVIRVENMKGNLIGVAFGYACHPTTLHDYKWSSDFVGFAQDELEKIYPGSVALFMQGGGGNQNVFPRTSKGIEMTIQHAKTLASAVVAVMNQKMNVLDPNLTTAYQEIDLPYGTLATTKEFEKMLVDPEVDEYKKVQVRKVMKMMSDGETIPKSYPYPIEVWTLGNQYLFALGGELLIEYAIDIKKLYGNNVFVLGYSNDVMAYIPPAAVIAEGGYEGFDSQSVGKNWSPATENIIVTEVKKLASELKIPFIK